MVRERGAHPRGGYHGTDYREPRSLAQPDLIFAAHGRGGGVLSKTATDAGGQLGEPPRHLLVTPLEHLEAVGLIPLVARLALLPSVLEEV